MTAPKGTRRDQVQRLRIRAIEAFVRRVEHPELLKAWPNHEEMKEFRELCTAADSPTDELAEIRARLSGLEQQIGEYTGRAMETPSGELKLG